MTTATIPKTTIPPQLDPRVHMRLLEEGYGPGAWHGPDLRAALADVSAVAAFWRPGSGRHSIAEIALHHAWCVRAVVGQLSGRELPPFPLDGTDWFELSEARPLSWRDILRTLEEQQRRLAAVVADIGAGTIASPLSESEQFDLVLGVTCHAIYHAGQVQLVKVLSAARRDQTPSIE
jgi:hypothetical protein